MRLVDFEKFIRRAAPSAGIACLMLAGTAALTGCGDQGLPPLPSGNNCIDPHVLAYPEGDYSSHVTKRVSLAPASLPGVQWMPADSVQAFFGTRQVRLVVAQGQGLYLVSWETGNPDVYRLSQGDEMPDLTPGDLSSPLFSADGEWIVFAAGQGIQGFALNVKNPSQPGWRIPLSTEGYVTADPHWVSDQGRQWVYFASTEEAVDYNVNCGQFPGYTYRELLVNDSTLDSLQVTGLPGAFHGGFSRDGVWAGTAYSPAALFNRGTPSVAPVILAGGHQKCNPSMNPFPPGSPNADFLMLLGFGGDEDYHTPLGILREGLHENLWIHDANDQIVWRGRLPDSLHYLWDKPEWSTHPLFASAVAARKGEEAMDLNCDLYAVKLPNLSQAGRDTLYGAAGYFKLGTGSLGRGTYTHLWVGP
jgi:hypothetical protein